MATSPLLYASRDTLPALDVSDPIRFGPSITGTISVASNTPTSASVYSNLKISYAGLDTGTDTVCIVPIFPSGTVPRRFSFEMALSLIPADSVYFFIGTADSGSNTFNAMGFSFAGDKFATIANGVFSSSFTDFGKAWYTSAVTGSGYIKKEFEFRTQTFTTGSDVVFRCKEYTEFNEENSTFQYDTVYKSALKFPWQKFPAAWNNKTFNKLFLGVTAAVNTAEINIDLFRVGKHIMDWDS